MLREVFLTQANFLFINQLHLSSLERTLVAKRETTQRLKFFSQIMLCSQKRMKNSAVSEMIGVLEAKNTVSAELMNF